MSWIRYAAEKVRRIQIRFIRTYQKQVTAPFVTVMTFRECWLIKDLSRPAGTFIVGFGTYHYKYASGREGDWMKVGFSPRKQSLTLYIMDGFGSYDSLLQKLGKHSTGRSCLYISKLEDVDQAVLRELIKQSVEIMSGVAPRN